MTRPQVDFEALLKAEGVPMTAEEVAAQLEADVTEANSIISNNSAMSPFWRLFSTCVVTPVLWLIKTLLANHVLPAMFAATAKGIYLDLKGWDVGVERKAAVKTQGYVTFTKKQLDDVVEVKAGTVIQTDNTLGDIYKVVVLEDSVIPAGTENLAILCEADTAGAAHNIGAGYYYVLAEPNSSIASVSNVGEWITQTGADEESDDEYALRIRNQSLNVGNFHIDAVYRAAIASFAGVKTDQLFFEHNAPRGAGTANCHVMVDIGETPQALIDSINDYITVQGYHGHGDDMQAFAIANTQHQLSLEFYHQANLSDDEIAQLAADIEAMVRAAFRESSNYESITRTYPLSVFSFSLLSSEIHKQLPQLRSIRWGVADISSAIALPRIESLTIENKGVAL